MSEWESNVTPGNIEEIMLRVEASQRKDDIKAFMRKKDPDTELKVQNHILTNVVIVGTKVFWKEFGGTPPTGLPLYSSRANIEVQTTFPKTKIFMALYKKAQWDHGGIYHHDDETDTDMANCPVELEVYPKTITCYRNRRHKFWNKTLHRYIAWYAKNEAKKYWRRVALREQRTKIENSKLVKYICQKAQFSHGGYHHQDRNINHLFEFGPYKLEGLKIPVVQYERPNQKFWVNVYSRVFKLINWWYR